MRKASEEKGKSKIHGIALYDDTWESFKKFRNRYNLSAEGAVQVLLENWDPFDLDENVKDKINDLKKDRSFRLSRQHATEITAAKRERQKKDNNGNDSNFFQTNDQIPE